MNVDLNPELGNPIRRKVASGVFASGSEVVCKALRLLGARDRVHAVRLE